MQVYSASARAPRKYMHEQSFDTFHLSDDKLHGEITMEFHGLPRYKDYIVFKIFRTVHQVFYLLLKSFVLHGRLLAAVRFELLPFVYHAGYFVSSPHPSPDIFPVKNKASVFTNKSCYFSNLIDDSDCQI